ncbi:IucA/IucC family protein [Salimicrobium sp. PL1-032A]|uniref:IucA/IucC family protein n=1 Tax=Salimicrobium sp. PL1-032A TaxID=3095364 RepID=UPI0032615AC2
MTHAARIAEQATMQSFLNCYMRETGTYEWSEGGPSGDVVIIPLPSQGMTVHASVSYRSLTGRHIFSFPVTYRVGSTGKEHTLDYVTMTTLLVKEWLIGQEQELAEDELVLRVLLSCKNIKAYVQARAEDEQALTSEDFDYIEAEQSLLFGHLLHPTPKSKQGLTEEEDRMYAPEYKGTFQLRYFSVDRALISQDSSISQTAAEILIRDVQQTQGAEKLIEEWERGRVLLPLHPLKAQDVLKEEAVQRLMDTGEMKYMGEAGPLFTATSSFRTLYSHDSRFMYKFSVPVKITNSLRGNLPKELARGMEVSRLVHTELGETMQQAHPSFCIIEDPAAITLKPELGIPGFEVVLRDNPFYEESRQVSLIAGLVQDHAYGGGSRLSSIIRGIAEREERTTAQVSLDWMDRYLSITLDPMMRLYDTYGIVLEAHQQNSVVRLGDGYPEAFYYRDNQGYYFSEQKAETLRGLLSSVNEKSDTICADEVAQERFRYYFFFNHLFGLINGFGVERLVEEEALIDLLRERLSPYASSSFVQSLLEERRLPCKANLLTRLHDMDELVGPMEAQSVYAMVDNPLAVKVGTSHAT